jgi:hypothetical protein
MTLRAFSIGPFVLREFAQFVIFHSAAFFATVSFCFSLVIIALTFEEWFLI